MEKRKDFYLIFKEAIHNCAKYARAKRVEVVVRKEDNVLVLSVKDDGVGFEVSGGDLTTFKKLSNLDTPRPGLGGNGLRNMRGRAAALGGSLEVTSQLGAGTELRLVLPV